MPSLLDYDPNDESQGGFGSGGASGSSSGGGALGGQRPSGQKEQPYTPWSRFTSANSGVSEREAAKAQSQVRGDVNRAQGAIVDASKGFNAGIDSQYAPVNPGNKAAGTRVRSAMQEIKNAAQEVREKILEIRDVGEQKPQ